MKKSNNSCKENKMLNHREVLEALLAGETLVDVNDKEMTLRFDGDTLVATGDYYQPLGSVEDVCLLDWKIKPRTININGYEVPEPMRVKPEEGEVYYVVCLPDISVTNYTFYNGHPETRWLSQGLLHKTREAAELHLEALLSFTKHE
jgi:hypothetical protein